MALEPAESPPLRGMCVRTAAFPWLLSILLNVVPPNGRKRPPPDEALRRVRNAPKCPLER